MTRVEFGDEVSDWHVCSRAGIGGMGLVWLVRVLEMLFMEELKRL